MQLRPYQTRLIDEVRQALRQYQRVLLQAPTGAGKTALTVYMMGKAADQGLSTMFIVHQNELLAQTSKALWEQKLEHGMIAAGKSRSVLPAQVASVQTLVRRLDRYPEPRIIIIDECHRSSARTYQKVLEAYPNALVVGLTATPQRTDGKGLKDTYDALIEGPTIRQLIDAGYLSDYEIYAPPTQVDVSALKKRGGDYARDELEAAMDRPTITGDAVATYRKHATGRRCVVMCVTIQHAEHVRDSYLAAGVQAELIEGAMTNAQREAVLDRFRRGETMVICNVQLLIEGVDIPSIEVVQWLRPTQSLIVWMQGNGRGLRPAPGKDRLLILDQVGNWSKHGLPDDDREWTLEGRKGRRRSDDEADLSIQQCASCFAVFRPGVRECPACGAPVEVKKKKPIEVVDGELEKIDIERQRKDRRREQGAARSIRELVSLGVRRELKKPAEWAAITHAARQRRKPTPAEFSEARAAHIEIKRTMQESAHE